MATRARRLWGRALQVALGLALGAGLVEAACYARDDGAFPHLNLYVPDAQLGARLRPHSSQRFALGQNPVSEITVNGAGLRGAELPAPRPGEILVLGDSQAFGLGVDDDQTFAARLAKLTGKTVVNAGVPTYGPVEYNALAAELIARRKPAMVVYTVNLLNDLFEHSRPNRERHRVWDGWAVRAETAPATVSDFPGRAWLFGRSHAVYALRRYLHERSGAPVPDGLPSEGSARDLLGVATRRAELAQLGEQEQRKHDAELAQAGRQLNSAQQKLAKAQAEISRGAGWQYSRAIRAYTPMAEANPGDIVEETLSEEARTVQATAATIREAIRLRDEAVEQLAKARASPAVTASLAERNAFRARVRALRAEQRVARRPESVLAPRLRELAALCRQHGAEPLVLALPIDVQVSSSEWRKYGLPPSDMSATLALTEDLIASARALGMRALDARPALLAALPGAFLDGDIHMTAKGHVAVASALAAALKVPAPTPEPEPGLPAGRTYPPAHDSDLELADQPEVAGAAEAGCELWLQDEWLTLHCGDGQGPPILIDATVLEGGRGEALTYRNRDQVRVRAPLLAGDVLSVRLDRPYDSQLVRAERKADGSFAIAFAPRVPGMHERPEPPAAPHGPPGLCQCGGGDGAGAGPCAAWYLPERRDCAQSYASDCDKQEQCILGVPDAWPSCAPGSVHADASGQCMPLCGANGACTAGRCQRWQGLDVCRPAT